MTSPLIADARQCGRSAAESVFLTMTDFCLDHRTSADFFGMKWRAVEFRLEAYGIDPADPEARRIASREFGQRWRECWIGFSVWVDE